MLEVADIFRDAGPAYLEHFGARMLPSHQRVMRDILECRTAALGGHVRQCDRCDEVQYSYHSCRNRHCPKCHAEQTERWLESWRSRLLTCPYFLLTFTLPEELRPLALSHQKLIYGILMKSAAAALLKLARDSRYLGARPAMIAVLHTWTRAMLYHPHVHLLVTGGGLAAPNGQARWLESRNPAFLFPDRALSVIFRAKVRDAIEHAGLLDLKARRAWRHRWVVHCKHAGNGEKVLEYIGRYVHRIAIANSRLESYANGQVTFRYRDNTSGEIKHCTVIAEEFIRRFLQHVLPQGFVKVRSYGLYSNSSKPALETARSLLGRSTSTEHTVDHHDLSTNARDTEPANPICPACRVGRMIVITTLARMPTSCANARAPP
jgi:hypothetical protein